MSCILARNRFGTYCVPSSAAHRPAARQVLQGNVYEAKIIELLRANLRGGDMVHAGAFFGDFLPALSPAARRVWAFEPNPESHACAAETVRMNGIGNVVLTHAALSSHEGEVSLQVMAEGVALGGASRIAAHAADRDCVAVRTVRIDDIVPESAEIRVIHLDVEGHEDQALAGAMRTIERNRPLLVLETDASGDMLWFLSRLGYLRMGRCGGNTVRAVAAPAGLDLPNRAANGVRRMARAIFGGRRVSPG